MTLYTSQTIAGYNSSPPSDDGAATESNKGTWDGVKTKLSDPVKTLSEAVNTQLVTAFAKVSERTNTGSIMCPSEGLSGTVSGTTGTYAAAYATLRNASDGEKSFATISETYDIDVSGVGGLDTGTKTTNTWYLFWLIGKADGTINGILSVQTASPTLPSGYTYWGFVGAAYYATTTFDAIEQIENKTARGVAIVVSAGTATTPTLVNLAAIAPLAARMAKGSLGTSRTPSGSSQVFVYSDSAGTLGEQLHQNSGGNTTATYAPFSSPLTTARSLWYKIDAGAGSAGYVRITGWEY
jgi:hypothetical protein